MDGLEEKKKQPSRYPLMSVKQAKSTLARLTRDLLNKKIDVATYRAAAYGLSVQCALLKFETPEKQSQSIQLLKIPESDFESLESHEEREARLDKICEERMAWKAAKEKAKEETEQYNAEFLKRQVTSYIGNNGDKVEIINPDFIVDAEMEREIGISKKLIIEKVEGRENTQDIISNDTNKLNPPPTSWKHCGIGAKRG